MKTKCYCIDTAPAPPPVPPCSLEGNRVVSLVLLGQFIKTYRIFSMVVVTYKFPRWKPPLWTGISHGESVLKALLFIGVRNKDCSVCTITSRNNVIVTSYQCSPVAANCCSIQADIILEELQQSENIHGLRYLRR